MERAQQLVDCKLLGIGTIEVYTEVRMRLHDGRELCEVKEYKRKKEKERGVVDKVQISVS